MVHSSERGEREKDAQRMHTQADRTTRALLEPPTRSHAARFENFGIGRRDRAKSNAIDCPRCIVCSSGHLVASNWIIQYTHTRALMMLTQMISFRRYNFQIRSGLKHCILLEIHLHESGVRLQIGIAILSTSHHPESVYNAHLRSCFLTRPTNRLIALELFDCGSKT